MSWFDSSLLVFGLAALLMLYIFHGRKVSIVHPVNVTIITVLFEFYGKYVWIKFGEPITIPEFPFTNSLLFILLFLVFMNVIMTFPPFRADRLATAMSLRLRVSRAEAISLIVAALIVNACLALIAGGDPMYGLINPIEFRLFMQKGGMFYFEFLMFFMLIGGVSVISWQAISTASFTHASFLLPYSIAAYVALNSGLRGRFIEILLIPVVVYAIKKNRVPLIPVALVSFLIVPFAVVFGLYRDAARSGRLSLNETLSFVGGTLDSSTDFFSLFMHRFDAFDNFLSVMESPPNDFMYLESVVDLLAQPIPRSLWPGKAYNFTSEMTLHYRPDLFHDGIALTYSAFSEAYLNFGFFAGPIVLALYIYTLNEWIQALANTAKNSSAGLMAFCLLYQLPFVALSAGFVNDVASVILILTIFCLFAYKSLRRISI